VPLQPGRTVAELRELQQLTGDENGAQRVAWTETWERARAWLRDALAASYPPGRDWDAPVAAAAREGRFRVEAAVNGADQIVCATGFKRGYAHDPLLRRLVDEHALATEDRWIVLDADCTVPSLTDEARTLALAGVHSQWAYPAADTLTGAKYAARKFLRRVKACRTR
jgi:hypothetical protein